MSISQDSLWRPAFAALANDHTRRVYAEIVLEHPDPGAALSPSKRRHAVTSLLRSGLIAERDDGYAATDVFARTLAAAPHPERPTGVARFLTADGAIDRYPARPADRAELLSHIAHRVLAVDETLTERELNERLRPYSDDVATLRRYLVDHELLERLANGTQYALVTGPADVAISRTHG